MKFRMLFFLAFLLPSVTSYAQYDDDNVIYKPNSWSKTTKEEGSTVINNYYYNAPAVEQDAADMEYSEMDIDAYNRQGAGYSEYAENEYADSMIDESTGIDEDFTYTNQIKKYYNPTVVLEFDDPDLYDLYTESQNIIIGSTTTYVNLGMGYNYGYSNLYDPYYYWGGYYYPSYYSPYYYYRPYSFWYGYYSPIYRPSFRPSAPSYKPQYGNSGYYSGNGRKPTGTNVGSSSAQSSTGRMPSSTTTSTTTSTSSGRTPSTSSTSTSSSSGNSSRSGYATGSSTSNKNTSKSTATQSSNSRSNSSNSTSTRSSGSNNSSSRSGGSSSSGSSRR